MNVDIAWQSKLNFRRDHGVRCTSVNETSGERSLSTISTAPGEKTTMRSLLSRDSTGYFVNFNLYACSVVLLGRLRTTQTTPLNTRTEIRWSLVSRIATWHALEYQIETWGRQASLLISRIYYLIDFIYNCWKFWTIILEKKERKVIKKNAWRKLRDTNV